MVGAQDSNAADAIGFLGSASLAGILLAAPLQYLAVLEDCNPTRGTSSPPSPKRLSQHAQRVEEPLARKLRRQLTRSKTIETRVPPPLQPMTPKRARGRKTICRETQELRNG
jgi:hypothetical protein